MESSKEIRKRVVIITDDTDKKKLIISLLTQSNHTFQFLSHASEIKESSDTPFAFIVCHQVSAETPKPQIPSHHGHERIIVLSNCQIEQYIVDALEQGAHHYFNINESHRVLKARIDAALRSHSLKETIVYAPYTFNMIDRLVEVDGKRVHLSAREFDCAHYLFTHKKRIVKTTELMVSVWSLPPYLDSRRIDTATCRLRKKLALDELEVGWQGWSLQRVRGVGFQLTSDME